MYSAGQIKEYTELYAKIYQLMKEEYLGDVSDEALSSATATVYIQLCKLPQAKIEATALFPSVNTAAKPSEAEKPKGDGGKKSTSVVGYNATYQTWDSCPECNKKPYSSQNMSTGKKTQQCRECKLWLNADGTFKRQEAKAQ